MMYKFLEHDADIGILASSTTLEGAFEEGATAMFEVMVDTSKVKAKKEFDICAEAESIEDLFIEWLNGLLAKKDIEEMAFSKFKVQISKVDGTYKLTGHIWGEAFLPTHNLKTEVKAATYSGLKYEMRKGLHTLRCVLDV